jgi:predicted DNA binding protein
MATIAEFSVELQDFPLSVVLDEYPTATVKLERIIPTNDAIMPYFWLRQADGEKIEEVLADRTDIGISLVEIVDGHSLFRAQWDPRSRRGVLYGLTESDVSLLSAVGTKGGWLFEVRGDDHKAVTEFLNGLRDEGIAFQLNNLHSLLPSSIEGYGLTDPQREALLLAHEMGYYNSPREVNLE